MRMLKEHIAVLKEQYENALTAAFASAADEASRKYGLPLSKLPMELVRSIAASSPQVRQKLEAWTAAASEDNDEDFVQESWLEATLPGYEDIHGAPLTVGEALKDVGERLESSRTSLKRLVTEIQDQDTQGRGFWLSVVLETATLIRVECGETLIIISDILSVNQGRRSESIKYKQDEARILRDDAKALIELARAKQGLW